MAPIIGEDAPAFTLKNQFGEEVTLSQFRGVKPVVLVFYPLAFTGTCTGELCELRDNLNMFEDQNVELLAVSVDSSPTLKVFAERENYSFSLLSDMWPHGAVSEKYGVFLADKGFANRGTFVINADGKLVAEFVTEPGQARDLAAYKQALENL